MGGFSRHFRHPNQVAGLVEPLKGRRLVVELIAKDDNQIATALHYGLDRCAMSRAIKHFEIPPASIKLSAYLMLDISKDIHSLSSFKRNTSGFVERMRGSGHPLVLTINGKAAIVVQDAASYQELRDRVDELEALAGIKRGLADVAAGRVTPLKKFEAEFRSKHGLSGRSR
jgi:prevent-host-death family protein